MLASGVQQGASGTQTLRLELRSGVQEIDKKDLYEVDSVLASAVAAWMRKRGKVGSG